MAVLALPAAWGLLRGAPDFTRPSGSLRVALLQTNVAQDEKFAAEHLPATLAWVSRALLAARADLVVAPETAVPLLPEQLAELSPGYWSALQQHFGAPVVSAIEHHDDGFIFIEEWLLARFQVDDGQAPVAKTQAVFDLQAAG